MESVATLTTGKNTSESLGSKRLHCLCNGYSASSSQSSAKYSVMKKHELRGGTSVQNFEFSQTLVEHPQFSASSGLHANISKEMQVITAQGKITMGTNDGNK